MLEILQYVLGGFWRFVGFTTILYIVLHYGVNGLIDLVEAISYTNGTTAINNKSMNVKLMYGDGVAGRQYYMKVNGIRIEIGWEGHDIKNRVTEIFKALKIEYNKEIAFKHDGRI